MPINVYNNYIKAIPILDSEQRLMDIETNVFPTLSKTQDRERILKKYQDLANTKSEPVRGGTAEEMARFFKHG
jgi:predicted Mrr-cat superfamily restriction endonuclease